MKATLLFFEHLVKCKGTDLLELQSGMFAIIWGVWVLNPWATNMDDRGVFAIMLRWAPEPFWGFLAFLVGVFKVGALIGGNVTWRSLACLVCFTWWCFMTYSMLMSLPTAPGCAIFLLQTITSGIVFLRVRYWNALH